MRVNRTIVPLFLEARNAKSRAIAGIKKGEDYVPGRAAIRSWFSVSVVWEFPSQ